MSAIWPSGVGRVALDAVDSTNAEALRRLAAGQEPPFWVSARRQTAGHGRRGRAWASSDRDLTASLALAPERLRPGARPAEIATLSFAAALAVADAAQSLAPGLAPELKWPNDVLVNGGKLAGVLLEAEAGALAIGVGFNLAPRPERTGLEASALRPAAVGDWSAAPPDPDIALTALAAAFDRWLGAWMADGFPPIRAAWLARATGLHRPAVARLANEEITGVFRDVDASGALVLDTPNGSRAVSAADVFFPSAGPAARAPGSQEA